ncbi:MAG TPA: hypothetical protein VH639_04555 [Bryobacteraceae bacterium]|jgi:hypothetical protein
MKLEKRLRALEARMLSEPVILRFADGSTRELCGPRGFLLHLFVESSSEDLTPEQTSQLDLIRASVAAGEPGGGHIIDLLRALSGKVDR